MKISQLLEHYNEDDYDVYDDSDEDDITGARQREIEDAAITAWSSGKFTPENLKWIALSPYYTWLYATTIIDARFPQGEESLLLNPSWCFEYMLHFKIKDWPEGRKCIKDFPDFAIKYAREVLHGPFPEAERWIAMTTNATNSYEKILDHYGKIKDKIRFDNLKDQYEQAREANDDIPF